jgi:hypothetical protein
MNDEIVQLIKNIRSSMVIGKGENKSYVPKAETLSCDKIEKIFERIKKEKSRTY